MKKILFWITLVLFLIFLGISTVLKMSGRDLDNNYLDPIEVEYAGENIIQNSEGQIYEYEYKFITDEGSIFLHLDKPKTFQEKDAIRYIKGDTTNFEFDSTIQNEIEEKEKLSIVFKNIAIGFGMFSGLMSILIGISNLKQRIVCKQEEDKNKLWKTDIPKIKEYIKDNYPEYQKTIPLLENIASLIRELDKFYADSKKEKNYRNKGLRKEIETIVDLYIKNIEIDEKFQERIISSSINDEFYSNLDRTNSYINSEIRKLTSRNDELLRKHFDATNSNAELDGKAIEYLAEKYKRN